MGCWQRRGAGARQGRAIPRSQQRDRGYPAIGWLGWGLAVAQPAKEFGQAGAFAVHKDADAVKLGGKPEHDADGNQHEQDGEQNLPCRGHLRAHAEEHDDGGAGREERGDDDPFGFRIAGDEGDEGEAEPDGDGGERGVLLEFLLAFERSAQAGEEGGVEGVAEQEVDNEEDNLLNADGEVPLAGECLGGEAGGGEGAGCAYPDADLGEADCADADELAGQQILGAGGGSITSKMRLVFS